ncbi:voltage-gated potassium channel [Coemansia reversa NRRL 1564]|uniref:Voltage-gated potassium channel n=1 Tax=Coemansia reversa (strain ATCC 12441 / NRRL 1564) TaxID=763665 RepID=A0A2G5B4G8_COERN|nr:voltage-gated potassium channel [Coemansia reversa NRRL 1564]|eukprot:PIA13904.1 voltage-gated potassium channel [Coemansia reversa NRRL 1564]
MLVPWRAWEDNGTRRTQNHQPAPNSLRDNQISSHTSSENIEDLFSEDPAVIRASQRARFYIGFSTAVLLLFLIVFMIDTLPQYRVRAQWRRIADLVNLVTAAFFAAEWLLRFYAFRRRIMYLFQPLTLIDVLGIIPGFIPYTTGETSYFGHVKWLRALQVLRVLRILRLTEYSVELYVTIRTLRKSLTQIIIVMMVIFIVLLTGCFLLFFAENDSLNRSTVQWMRKNHGVQEVSPFQNIFFCLYWGFVTITTVGYGEYTPVSPWGQVIACVTMFMGVFTIVFPTSIISNNFASEWEAFHKAQKLKEQRQLQRENRNKRRELTRLWSYANQTYDESIHSNRGPASDLGNEESRFGYNSSDSSSEGPAMQHNKATKSEKARMFDQVEMGAWGGKQTQQQVPTQQQSNHGELLIAGPSRVSNLSPGSSPVFFGDTKIGPKEYSHILDVSKRVERDLGIPGINLGDIDTDNEINQNLVVSAMYSKLYNKAYTTLCERMVIRLVEHLGFGSIDSVAEFLQYHPGSESMVHSWPHDNKLTILEYKLLEYVLNNLKSRMSPGFDFSPSRHRSPPSEVHTSSPPLNEVNNNAQDMQGPDSGNGHRTKEIKRRLRHKMTNIKTHFTLSQKPTHPSIHDYMTSSIAKDRKFVQSVRGHPRFDGNALTIIVDGFKEIVESVISSAVDY